ncbi:quinone oxidoreductase family protein [Streptomyces sp. NPDC006365]|uniref:quinone oxidoreductase family protein n=1 Tax=Streptomyces sp. NPDC006365 TaxID=3364744 RepID=UPI0036864DA6
MRRCGPAVVVGEHGGPGVLEVHDLGLPEVAGDQVLVEVAYAGVNYVDIYQREGVYPRQVPFVPGGEGAGRVLEVGAEASGLSPGDRVAWQGAPGAYARYVSVPASQLLRIPDEVTDEQAAALPLQGLTAHYLATSSYAVQPGDTVLIHAGAGGVGLLLTQIAKIRGATVITTVSSPGKAEASRAAGADQVLGYDDFHEELRRQGVHAVYDGVGRSTFERSLKVLRRRGTLVLYGGSSGHVASVDPLRLTDGGSLTLKRPTLRDFVVDRAELEGRFQDLLDWLIEGRLHLHIHRHYPLADAKDAHRALASRDTVGKLLLAP